MISILSILQANYRVFFAHDVTNFEDLIHLKYARLIKDDTTELNEPDGDEK